MFLAIENQLYGNPYRTEKPEMTGGTNPERIQTLKRTDSLLGEIFTQHVVNRTVFMISAANLDYSGELTH